MPLGSIGPADSTSGSSIFAPSPTVAPMGGDNPNYMGGQSPAEYAAKLDEALRRKESESLARIAAAEMNSQQRLMNTQRAMTAKFGEVSNQVNDAGNELQELNTIASEAIRTAELAASRQRAGMGRTQQATSVQSQLTWYGGQQRGGRIPPPPGARAPIEGTVVSRR